MSGYPAERLKLWDRGLLRPGMKADVVVSTPTIADRAGIREAPSVFGRACGT